MVDGSSAPSLFKIVQLDTRDEASRTLTVGCTHQCAHEYCWHRTFTTNATKEPWMRHVEIHSVGPFLITRAQREGGGDRDWTRPCVVSISSLLGSIEGESGRSSWTSEKRRLR
ncbi:hypothetical protein PsorP6_013322 [Peronosclerospora sorghi]|uniref:Uncharacterized protein n=1 Tax=Peronosclerospora sorghi TaxID=230839 RepID=A0ACC0WIW2_9STRA|nr:hypothetical protein PsorP6_013322 [Peronosclerospora sorghi]